MILTAKGKDVANENVLGTGKHTYELVSDWPDLPHSIQLGYTHGVAIDSQNRVYIFNQSASAMCVFDQDGKFIKTWNNGYDKGAHGLTLVKEAAGEFLWLCDYATQRVLKTTLDGEEVLSLKMPPMPDVYPTPDKYKPTNAAPIPDGDAYVADGYGQSWVHQYDKTGNYIRSWGGKGKEQGKFDCPHGIAIDKRGGDPVVVVADRVNVRLQTFALDGNPLSMYGHENLRFPCHFDFRDGDMVVPDLHGRVTVFDKDNQLITQLGDTPGVEKVKGYPNLPKETWTPGKFISPHSACWDLKGDMYVVEWIKIGRITKLKRV